MLRKIKHTITRLRGRLDAHPFSQVSVDRFLADGRGAVEIPAPDTGLLAAALSDGDNHVLRDEVYVTPTGGLFHHDLGGAR